MTLKADIDSLVSKFAADLEALVRTAAVQAVQGVLGGSAPQSAPRLVSAAVATRKKSGPKPRSLGTPEAARAPAAVKPQPGKRIRRTPADLDRDVGRIVSYVRANPGVSGEKARAAVGFGKTAWVLSVRRALETKQITSKGERRSTTYNIAGASTGAVAPFKRTK